MDNQEFEERDVVIIGAGPVGLFAIFECGMLGLKCHVVDALDHIGGQCVALYPEKPIYDIPAFPEIEAANLIQRLEKQSEPFSPIYHLGQQVIDIQGLDGGEFLVVTSKGTQIRCRCVIVAAGGGAFGPNKPPLDNIEDFEGKSIFYSCRSKEQFRGKNVVVAGGGDSAVDWALSLCDVVENLYIVHRRGKFRAAPESVRKLDKLCDDGVIEKIVPYQLKSLEGSDGILKSVIVSDIDGNDRLISADILLPFYGLSMDIGPIAQCGIEIDSNHVKVNKTTMETNIKGVFAIGDVATYEHKLKLILTGFAEAASAAHSVYRHINPDVEMHMEYSTSKGVAS